MLVTMFFLSTVSDGGPFAIMRIEKKKSIRAGNKSKEHNARLTPCANANPEIKNQRIYLNEDMVRLKEMSFKDIFDERIQGQKIRKNAVYAVEIIMTFSPSAINENQLNDWRNKSIAWACSIFGADNVIDCVMHLDETTPHIHLTAIPIDRNGKLNARAFLEGNGKKFSKLQDSYAEAVASFGLKRGISKAKTKAQHEASSRWHNQNAQKEAELLARRKIMEEVSLSLDNELKFIEYYNEFISKQQQTSNTKEDKNIER